MDAGDKLERPKNPREKANFFEIITFSWIFHLFKRGRERDLEINDLYTNLKDHSSSLLGNELEKKWRLEITNANKLNKNPSLLRALIRMFGTKFMLYGIIFLISEIVLKMSQPLFIGGILAFFNTDVPKSSEYAYFHACCLVLNMLITTILYHSTQIEMLHFGMKMRVACCSAIFKKALRLSKKALGKTTIGQVVNLLSNDVNRFDSALIFLHFLWISPIQTIVATYFIWQEVGVSSIVGLAACFIFIPLQGWLGKKTSEYRLRTAIRTDERVCLMNEIISGIQVIKMYTWEKPFAHLVQYARKKEIQEIRSSSYIKTTLASFVAFHAKLSLFFCIFSYVLLGNNISTKKVFVITTYYKIMQSTLTICFPQGISRLAEMLISIKRLQNYLLYEEKDGQMLNISKTDKTNVHRKLTINIDNSIINNINNDNETALLKKYRIVVSNATAKWSEAQIDNSIENINLTIMPGRVVAIIGPVGAGKSSLIQAILRELPLSKGNIYVRGVISYASQEPWLFAGSVEQNILFGLPRDKERYREVINVCALEKDFEQLPYGDKTIVGERGISLSGGQRARINLARAVYKQADIYLLDDPLSAVDTHVGRHLFEKCIKGYLNKKTCIFITHQLQYLSSIDQIVLMDSAKMLAEGTYEKLQAFNLDFTKLLRSSVDKTILSDNESNIRSTCINNFDKRSIFEKQVSINSVTPTTDGRNTKKVTKRPAEVAESRSFGNISYIVYLSYISAGGSCCKILFLILISILTQLLSSGGDLWITHWVNLEEHVFYNIKNHQQTFYYTNNTSTTDNSINKRLWWSISRQTCVNVFFGLTFIMILATVIRTITFVSVCMRASMHLHNNMFNSIVKATMIFFNKNSSGRILNRFSKDIGTIDEILPVSFMDSIRVSLTLIGIVIVIGITNNYLMIPTLIVGYIFYKFGVFYLSTSRSIKRLEGISRSPVFSHFNACLQGMTTIRAFKAENILSHEFDNHQDLHSSAWYLFITSNRALGLWLDVVCIIYISIVIFSFILIGNDTFSGNVGLAITQSFGLVGILQWGLRQSTDLENQMTSVERILEYTDVPQEGVLESSPDQKSPPNWPSNGQIIFKNFYLRYSSDTPYIIKNFNIHIKSMQKIGIVGRTGAGKSSLIGALFRLALNEGYIFIDGIEIHELGLHELRSRISIIPQEPILFSGTMRKNLDPFDEYSDHFLWNALDEVELKDVINDLPKGLNFNISEGGSNFSVGQRQLICLARAIVRNNKIILLDEATSNIDPQTDALIQNTIRNKFQSCTVLTIAHRLNTIMDSDRVLVMDAGTMVELDHPHKLLKNKDGFLYKMVEQTGQDSADLLHNIALESYERRIRR